MYSWQVQRVKRLANLRISSAETAEREHNLTSPIYDEIRYVTTLVTYSPAARPYPLVMECLNPDLKIFVNMSNSTNAWVTFEKIWNTSAACLRTGVPPPQLLLRCEAHRAGDPCDVAVNVFRTRNPFFSTELRRLISGKSID